jgi:hypothetical protein
MKKGYATTDLSARRTGSPIGAMVLDQKDTMAPKQLSFQPS